jgi:hypothetical protein
MPQPTQMPLRAGRRAPEPIALDPWRAADPMTSPMSGWTSG